MNTTTHLTQLEIAMIAARILNALFALLLSSSTFALGTVQTAGRVMVNNTTDQVVHVNTDSWRTATGSLVTSGGLYTFAPGERAYLMNNGVGFTAAKYQCTFTTAAGKTPIQSGKAWVFEYSTTKKTVEVRITESLLPKRVEKRAAVREAWALIEANTMGIMGVAHPSATDLRATFEGSSSVTRGGRRVPGYFVLTYKYHWRSGLFDNRNWSRIDFYFDGKGHLYNLQPASDRTGATSSFAPPFSFSNAVMDLTESLILDSEEVRNDPLARKLLQAAADKNDARLWLQVSLRVQQS